MVALERKYSKEIKAVLKNQYEDAADYFSHGVGHESVNDAVNFNRKDMLDAYNRMYLATSTLFHEKTKSNIKSSNKYDVKQDDPGKYWANLNKWMFRNIAAKVSDVQKTTKKKIQKIVLEGLSEGSSNRDIADNILDSFAALGKWRAMAIARTEVHTAAVKATDETMQSFDLIYKKEWSASMDERTRPAHIAADVQEVESDEPFIVGGEELMFPGDPEGSAENVINCRCIVLYNTERKERINE